jgi:hypothetical protein
MLASGAADAFDRTLGIGAAGGYSSLLRRIVSDPDSLHGACARARLSYGFNDTWGLSAAGGMSWYQDYAPMISFATENEDGEIVTETTHDIKRTELRTRDLALSLVYALDIMRVTPFLAMGVAATQTRVKMGTVAQSSFDIALRFDVGFDVSLAENFAMGIIASFDNYLTGNSEYLSATDIMLSATFLWDIRNFGHTGNKR